MQEFLIHLVILVVMAGVLLFFAIPFLAAAWLIQRRSAAWLGDGPRLALASAVAAFGIAPSFDAYRQPQPIWLRWCEGDAVGTGVALLSFALTWAVVFVSLRSLRRRPAASAA